MSIVFKWGNSLAISIPKNIAECVNLKEGSAVRIDVANQNIVISLKPQSYTLEELLEGASPKDFDGEFDWGDPVGEEIW